MTDGHEGIDYFLLAKQEQIQQWKKNAEHQMAQQFGRSRWYKSYRVQIVEVVREYCHES